MSLLQYLLNSQSGLIENSVLSQQSQRFEGKFSYAFSGEYPPIPLVANQREPTPPPQSGDFFRSFLQGPYIINIWLYVCLINRGSLEGARLLMCNIILCKSGSR